MVNSPYYCKDCDRHFGTNLKLHDHNSSIQALNFSARFLVRSNFVSLSQNPYNPIMPYFCRQHHPEMVNSPYYCKDCDRHFGTNRKLRDHMTGAHFKTRPYKCRAGDQICDKVPSIYYVSKRTGWLGLENGHFC